MLIPALKDRAKLSRRYASKTDRRVIHDEGFNQGCDRSQPTKALTGQRTPNKEHL